MIGAPLLTALNQQIHAELDSAYLYLAMAAYFEASDLPGFAHWMRAQSEEEHGHAMKIFDFVNDRDGRVVLQALGQPKSEFASPLDAVTQALGNERRVSGLIHALYAQAVRENDYATQVLLHWFINEQIEEEKSVDLIIRQLERIGDDGTGVLLLDKELGARASG
ncbi:MAG: ferritin [Actinobacteria bacterium]|nr:ferritin [Actinomycetota bacterium]